MQDFSKIKTEYITGNINLSDLADLHGISRATIFDRSKKERWVKQKKDYKSKIVEKALKKATTIESNKLASLMSASDKISKVIDKVVSDSEQFNRYIITDSSFGDGESVTETKEKVFKKYDTKAISDLTRSIKDLTVAMRDLYSIPSYVQSEQMRINNEKLEIDKSKIVVFDDEKDKTGVVLLPEVEADEDE